MDYNLAPSCVTVPTPVLCSVGNCSEQSFKNGLIGRLTLPLFRCAIPVVTLKGNSPMQPAMQVTGCERPAAALLHAALKQELTYNL